MDPNTANETYVDVTDSMARDISCGALPATLRGLTPCTKISAAMRQWLSAVDGLRLGFVSKAVVYDEALRPFKATQRKTIARLVMGGLIRVHRVAGPLPGVHAASRIGARAECHYKLVVCI